MIYVPFLVMKQNETQLISYAKTALSHPNIIPCFVLTRGPDEAHYLLAALLRESGFERRSCFVTIPHEATVTEKGSPSRAWLNEANQGPEEYFIAMKNLAERDLHIIPVYQLNNQDDVPFALRFCSELAARNRRVGIYFAALGKVKLPDIKELKPDYLFVNIKQNDFVAAKMMLEHYVQVFGKLVYPVRENREANTTNKSLESEEGFCAMLKTDLHEEMKNEKAFPGFGDFCLLKNDLNERGGNGAQDIQLFAAVYDRGTRPPAIHCLHSCSKGEGERGEDLSRQIENQLQNMDPLGCADTLAFLREKKPKNQARFHVLTAFHYLNQMARFDDWKE